MTNWLTLILCAGGGYLLGSIPFGVIATRLGGVGDVRKIGSGNIGATNVLRTGRRDLAAITLLGDGGKGAVAVLIAALVSPLAAAIAGGAAFLGHLFPVWLKFRGGKGVATFFGVAIAADWRAGLMSGASWIAMALIFRRSSLASLTAAAVAPVLFGVLVGWGAPAFWLSLGMAVLIFIRHRENIARLLKGEEPKIGASKKAA
ncbi:MAG: glycerol-3-phosphate 1-O-acyltransferase PlsY [Caulobacteraceae bacterium]